MANARGKEIDNPHLSIVQAEARGFLHRDYIAHCLRWTHVVKYLSLKKRYKEANILDVGCGKDMPLARTLMTSRLAPMSYLGVDFNAMEIPSMFEKTTFQPKLIQNEDFSLLDLKLWFEMKMGEGWKPNYVTCFEVLEHVEPWTAIKILGNIGEHVSDDNTCWFSTPCWDEKVGAAANHVNEMTYEAFGSLLEHMGFKILDHWGTFASIKDYRIHMDLKTEEMFDKLKEYYDSNYIATIFAPLYPQHSRNCLWETQFCGRLKLEERNFGPIDKIEGRLGSSTHWRELVKCTNAEEKEVSTEI